MKWISCGDKLPKQQDGDENGKVLVWHRLQGAMLARWDRITDNRFYDFWMRIQPLERKWISIKQQTPTAADADIYGCVLVKDRHNGHRVTGWHQPEMDGGITDWQRLPRSPEQ